MTGKRVVQPGDHIEIGPLKFVVEYQMSTDARARLARGEAGEDFEVVEVEVVEAGASPFKFDSGEEVPFAEVEDETELVQSRSASDERIPVAEVEEIEEAELIVELDDDWHLPKSGDLKSLNPDLDKKPKKKR